MLGIFQKLRFWSGNGKAKTDKPKSLITPELHEDMLAKKAAVDARRKAHQATLTPEERKQRALELNLRIKNDMPMRFRWVDAIQGVPVGFELYVFHLTLHDMMPHACVQLLTEEVLLAGLRINAVQHVRFHRLDDWNAFTVVQPRWVVGIPHPQEIVD